MFSVHCPRHGADVLVGTRVITGIENRRSGMIVRWRCTCGHEGAFVDRPDQHAAAAAVRDHHGLTR